MTENEVIQRLKNRLKTEEQRYGKEFVKEYFDDIDFAISALKEIQQYWEMDRKLREVYGECDGLLEKAVNLLCDHKGIDVGRPIKARLLTDEDVDKWEAYKSIGTVEDIIKVISFLSLSDDDLITKDFHELFEYRKIGTVEECREAVEK